MRKSITAFAGILLFTAINVLLGAGTAKADCDTDCDQDGGTYQCNSDCY